MPFTYIIQCGDGTLYTGWTTDLERRVTDHNAGHGAHYTRSRRPVRLVYWEEHATSAQAQRRESVIKGLSRREKLGLIADQEKG